MGAGCAPDALREQMKRREYMGFLNRVAQDATYVTSVCEGACSWLKQDCWTVIKQRRIGHSSSASLNIQECRLCRTQRHRSQYFRDLSLTTTTGR